MPAIMSQEVEADPSNREVLDIVVETTDPYLHLDQRPVPLS